MQNCAEAVHRWCRHYFKGGVVKNVGNLMTLKSIKSGKIGEGGVKKSGKKNCSRHLWIAPRQSGLDIALMV